MRRDWLTLAFGLVLVGVVLGLSLRQNLTQPPPDDTQRVEAGSVLVRSTISNGGVIAQVFS